MFKNRFDAAEQLADILQHYKEDKDVVIVAIPRGGLELGSVLAERLEAPLDVIFSKKIGAPGNPEYAIGALTLDDIIIEPSFLFLQQKYIEEEAKRLREQLREREGRYREVQKKIPLKDKIVILTDDGVATGTTLSLTIDLIKKAGPKKIIVALPVGPKETIEELSKKVDELICLIVPEYFYAIGMFYENFNQVSDDEALRYLKQAKR